MQVFLETDRLVLRQFTLDKTGWQQDIVASSGPPG
jgi:hypothetical protein